jgi:hypothetical protein
VKIGLLLLGVVMLIAMPLGLFLVAYLRPGLQQTVVTSQGPTIERLERLAQLITTRVHIADVLVGEDQGCQGSWLIRGDGLLGIDLGHAEILDRDEQTRQATIVLPQPCVLQARVDHEKTRTWEVRRTSWVPWRGDKDGLRDSVMREAQRLVAQAANSPENLAHARTAAEAILQGFYEEVGWRVRVRWKAEMAVQP